MRERLVALGRAQEYGSESKDQARDQAQAEDLSPVTHPRFLVYLMGPYKAFSVADMVSKGVDPDDLAVSFNNWDETAGDYAPADVVGLLERTRDHLRSEAGLNGFLAIDADVDLDAMDAATQSIEFALASNVIALIAPQVGKNLGVGIETGSVLEGLDTGEREHERVVFVHEAGVRSAMIAALSRRWEATVYSYRDEADLAKQVQLFAVDVMRREQVGDLPRRDSPVE